MSFKRNFTINVFADRGDANSVEEAYSDIVGTLKDIVLATYKGSDRLPSAADNLADIAVDRVWSSYLSTAKKMGDDSPNVDVYSERTSDGAKVVAEGDDVFFLEFGIGNDVSPEGGDFAEQSGVDVSPGSWSAAHGGPYSQHGYWYYSKSIKNRVGNKRRVSQKYTGVPGSHGMFHAQKHIESLVEREINRVLREI